VSLDLARRVLAGEAEVVDRLARTVGSELERAVEVVLACRGRVVWTGMGKSGIICRKLAATMSSTGTPALFLHPAEAVHGDLGAVTRDDVVIAVSNSGETEELVRLTELVKRLGVPLVVVTSNLGSCLAQVADICLDLGVEREACPLDLVPTASTTASLALGDALALEVAVRRGFEEQDFALLHPGGKLGRRFLKVRDLMHTGEALPRVGLDTVMKDVIYEMSRKGLGVTAVVDATGALAGVITDGDLRRLMEREADPMRRTAGEVMHPGCAHVRGDELASAALRLLEERRITSLMVADHDGRLEGVLHVHDLWGLGLM